MQEATIFVIQGTFINLLSFVGFGTVSVWFNAQSWITKN